MIERGNRQPYRSLGTRIKRLREYRHQTLLEVSGAVEIEPEVLRKIEQGAQRPSEDVLLLLISFFAMAEDEALKLWELAKYDQQNMPEGFGAEEDAAKTPVAVAASDARINYTDMVHVTVNNYGVVLNFMQGNGPGNQPIIVSRVGMSKEHARSVLDVLQKTMQASEPKQLPSSESTEDSQTKN
ncbi:MAG: helix-turn-helix domain-containing protein [Candidatus Saccharibacteria bacterium]|nr:helix-turn-helix domain-containing protein [Candidatus Saccharibacteria bacterium]